MSSDRESIAARLKDAREYVGMSQQEVSEALKLPRSAISLIETAQRGVDSTELQTLARLYERPIGYFTGEDSQPISAGANMLAKQVAKLSEGDRDELLRFSEYLVQRAKSGENK